MALVYTRDEGVIFNGFPSGLCPRGSSLQPDLQPVLEEDADFCAVKSFKNSFSVYPATAVYFAKLFNLDNQLQVLIFRLPIHNGFDQSSTNFKRDAAK